eukprot:SAG25_NODE_14937_length_196_cov_28.783505_1_plen_27_part_01
MKFDNNDITIFRMIVISLLILTGHQSA